MFVKCDSAQHTSSAKRNISVVVFLARLSWNQLVYFTSSALKCIAWYSSIRMTKCSYSSTNWCSFDSILIKFETESFNLCHLFFYSGVIIVQGFAQNTTLPLANASLSASWGAGTLGRFDWKWQHYFSHRSFVLCLTEIFYCPGWSESARDISGLTDQTNMESWQHN